MPVAKGGPAQRRKKGAGDGIRTHDILLGKQTLCQLSYTRSATIDYTPTHSAVKSSRGRPAGPPPLPAQRKIATGGNPGPGRNVYHGNNSGRP